MIDPYVASGTRDILPTLAIQRDWIIAQFRQTFERYGFVPIDTPVLERREVLYAKGGEEVQRQVFEVVARGQTLEASDLALRFDLTVPLARFMARHVDELGVPFKRYHIGLVYRGERAQRGRYREFYQCDFDTIGSRSAISDAEIALVIHDGLRAVGVPAFTIRLNHRMILNGMLASLGVAEHSAHVLRSLDKLDKIGRGGVLDELQFGDRRAGRIGESTRPNGDAKVSMNNLDAGPSGDEPRPADDPILKRDTAERIIEFIESASGNTTDQTLRTIEDRVGSHSMAAEGIRQLRAVCELLAAGGVATDQVIIQVGLARGLDYYTGVIFESMVTGHENFGSVCSGGRYDDLAGLFTERQLPGVGASFGLDRLAQLMADAGYLPSTSTIAPVLVVNFQASDWSHYVAIATELRRQGIATELYPDAKPLRDQFGYASSRGHRVAVIAGPDEISAGAFALRDMSTRQQQKNLPRGELVARVQSALAVMSARPA